MHFIGWYLFVPVRIWYGVDMRPKIVARWMIFIPVLAVLIVLFERFAHRHPIWITGDVSE